MDTGTWVMAAITLASVAVAMYTVRDNKLRYLDSILPIISFKLSYSNKHLNLEIMNTGKSPAYGLVINIRSIEGINKGYNPDNDNISNTAFDLYPDEVVSNHIASVLKRPSKVLLTLDLSYKDEMSDEPTTISRTVYYYNDEDEIINIR